jgi:hypothetical protein
MATKSVTGISGKSTFLSVADLQKGPFLKGEISR